MKIYSTLTGDKREFVPVHDNEVRMYVCGVTPYGPAHVGHAMSYIVFDVVRRYLEYRGYAVKHVQNFTDVDDKLIDRAAREHTTVDALAERYIGEYMKEMRALNVQEAHVYPRASKEIPSMIAMIGKLIDDGFAYPSNGDVYYRVTRLPGYGKLSHRSLDGMRAGARVEVSEVKEHPMDFVLWKGAKAGEPQWPSPWGPGRPGWHIECSAMALTYLGNPIDIHGGGQDLIFPHHENEIAQSEAATHTHEFARFWMHNGLLQMNEQKMSKSLGNLITIKEALSKFSADGIRLFILGSLYRNPTSYSEEAIASSERAVARLRQAVTLPSLNGQQPLDPAPFKDRFIAAMDDDFNTPQAIAVLFDLAREINRGAEAGHHIKQAQDTLRELGTRVLGLTFEEKESDRANEAAPFIDLLVQVRRELRAKGDYASADRIRQGLTALNVVLTDTPASTDWKWQA